MCVCLFTLVLWTLHNYFCLDVCYLKDWSPNKQGTVWRSAHAVVLPSRWCIANIYLPETTGSSRSISKMLLRGKRCVYICDYHFDPSPPHQAIQSTNEGRHTTSRFLLWTYTAHLELFVSFKLSGHCGGHMVPIENSLLPSGHISVSLWFKTETKRGFSSPSSPLSSCLLSFVFSSPSWNNLHQQEELQFSFCFVPYLYWSAVKVILHLIITILPRKRLTLGTRKWLWRRGGAVLCFRSHMLKKKKKKANKPKNTLPLNEPFVSQGTSS